jgi:competence protein ComFB
MSVINAMEPLVKDVLDIYWPQLKLPCKCDICKDDVYAITLNQLPPRYVSKANGTAYVKAQNFTEQSRIDILNQIVKASGKVAQSPSHG